MTIGRIPYGLPTKPSARTNHAMAFDPSRNAIFLFGGDLAGVVFDDLWVWYIDQPELGWSLIPTLGARPTARSNMGLIVDTTRDRLVMHAGADVTPTQLTDTWAVDLTQVDAGPVTWADLAPATTPPGRSPVAMVYDPARDQIVRFGGLDSGAVPQHDTWEFDGTDWADVTPASPSDSPADRAEHSMVFDRARGAAVVYGGFKTVGAITYEDTWLWTGGPAWILHAGSQFPPARHGAPSAYSPRLGGLVVALGTLLAGAARDDTWVFGSAGWRQIHPSARPPLRDSIPSGAAETDRGMVLFGGDLRETAGTADDTWAIDYDEEWTEPAIGLGYVTAEIEVDAGARLADPGVIDQSVISFPPGLPVRGPLAGLALVSTVPANTRILIALALDGTLYYWDGDAWAASDGSESQMSTIADAATNIATFPLAAGVAGLLDPRVRLISDNGVATPELDQIEITAAFAARPPVPPRLVHIVGQIDDEGGDPLTGARLVVSPPATGVYHGRTLIGRERSAKADALGSLELEVFETATISAEMTVQLELGKETRGPVTVEIPDQAEIRLEDILP